ncbi:MAG TPA: hypothetical protein PLQ19_08195 [Aeromicrobium sp.]|nr:hypothetical protein [Aeromicrobium sp.]
MSVAARLGVEDLNGPLMAAARAAWPGWVETDPELGVVEDLADLRRWVDKATAAKGDVVMVKLAALAVTDDDAAVALAWLMVPKMARLARRLADVAADIDGMVASQLWIEIRARQPLTHSVSTTLWFNLKRGILGEFGIGDAGERADKTWASTTTVDSVGDMAPFTDEAPELQRVLRVLFQHLMDAGELTIRDVKILAAAADYADWLDKPMRGRAGLTSPDALEALTKFEPRKARTRRREVGMLLDRIAVLAADLDVEMLLAQYPDDGVSFGDCVYGLGSPRQAAAMRNFRDDEVSMVRAHIATWDSVTERCGTPDICPECIREDGKREMAALKKAG